METKNDDTSVTNSLIGLGFTNMFTVPPIGLSGGLALLWKDGVDISVLTSSANVIDTKVNFKKKSSDISFVYGAPQQENRAAFWNFMAGLGETKSSSWLITGDFNDILDNNEKVGGPPRWEGSFLTFRSFVSHQGLWDVKHSGNPLSWRGTRYSHFIQSRLDRSLANCA